ncbi:MAG TPA: HAD hydrolase family protein [Thermomicrobiales bacterium]|nr:HAD hydrolase family protein [Thermomicrobiales bacterium]
MTSPTADATSTTIPSDPAADTRPPIAMIAMDLDGTILEAGEVIRPEVIAALAGLAARGVRCVTATGRQAAFQRDLFARYEMDMASTGIIQALIGDEREIFLGTPDGYEPHTAWNDALRARWVDLFPLAWGLMEDAKAEALSRGWAVEFLQSPEVAYERGLPTLVCEDAAQGASLCLWVQEQIDLRTLPLATNRNIRLVQAFDVQAGKGPALAELARVLGIPNAQVLAIGDSSNDYTMLDPRFNHGFRTATPANAEEELKQLVRAGNGYVASAEAGLGTVEAIDALTFIDTRS